MVDTEPQAVERFSMLCRRCDRPVLAQVTWVGREVRCPHCRSVLRVPKVPADGRPLRADAPSLLPRYSFNFACPRCECLLEAHTGMCGQLGRCPTCGAQFHIPHLRGKSGRPEKAKLLEGEEEYPTPIHAYAASGDQAPQIVRLDDGTSVIQCPRCHAQNLVEADVCAQCGTPFTVDAATTIGQLRQESRAAASLTLGVLGLVLFPLVVPGLVATWLGLRSVMFTGTAVRKPSAFAGLVLGAISLMCGVTFWYFQLR